MHCLTITHVRNLVVLHTSIYNVQYVYTAGEFHKQSILIYQIKECVRWKLYTIEYTYMYM